MIAIVSPSENRAIQTENPSRIIREITAKLARNFAAEKIINNILNELCSGKNFRRLFAKPHRKPVAPQSRIIREKSAKLARNCLFQKHYFI